MRSALRLLLIGLIFGLSACGTTSEKPAYPTIGSVQQQQITQLRRTRLEPVDAWNIKGRIAVQYAKDGFSAGLRWQQAQDKFNISLTDPLGRVAARLEGNDQQVMLSAQGETYSADSPDQLMQKQLGWALPLDSLYHWSKGIPDPNHPLRAVGYDNFGRPVSLLQDGCQVYFKQYPDNDVLSQPKHVSIERPTFKAKLVISSRD